MKQSIQDTALTVIDSLSQHPILKGVIPGIAGVGLSELANTSTIEIINEYVRYGTLYMGATVMALTLAVKIVDTYKYFFKKKD